jgi:hypothetical protein
MDIQEVRPWRNSTFVLVWLGSLIYKWKAFVANRMAELQEVISVDQWPHVNDGENPACCVSQGIGAYSLDNHMFWWAGPCGQETTYLLFSTD